MKCGIYYWEVPYGKKGKRKITTVDPYWKDKTKNHKVPDSALRCDGDIVIDVQAVDEPYYGGSSAALEVKYKCTKCNTYGYCGLPADRDELNKFVNWMLLKTTRKEVEAWYDEQQEIARIYREELIKSLRRVGD